ncbi:MAG: response regulator [Actinomycetota bacterium]|nr:response regulator [Actinomycetota bacterium]
MRVLVVDDDVDIQTMVRMALDDCDVLVASDGLAALAVLRQTRVDVVLLDVMMPAMDGFAVLRRIRGGERCPDVPVVMLTAKAGERDHVTAYRDGADAYLTKPFGLDELEAALADVTARSVRDRTAARRAELERAQLLAQIEHTFGV